MNAQEANERCVGLALTLSAEMLKNGGETYRAEDCALRVLAAAGSVDTQVMAMPTNVLVTATFGGQTITRSRSVRVRSVDLEEIDRLNTVSRAFASGALDVEGAIAEIGARRAVRPVWLMSLYALLQYNDTYSRSAALSPSIWVAPDKLSGLVGRAKLTPGTVLYMDYGSREMGNHDGIRREFSNLSGKLMTRGIHLTSRIVPGGTHCEASWEKQLPFVFHTLLYEVEE